MCLTTPRTAQPLSLGVFNVLAPTLGLIDTDEAGAEKELTELLHLLEQLSQEEKQQLICTAKKMLEEEKQGAD